MKHKFPYKWNLSDGYPAKGIEHHGTTVMTTFACGGGSTMGYKLAGYNVVAANDIDPQMAKVYKAKQILDDLFFDFIDLAEKMQPKIVIAENVKGMLQGHAKWYTREVVRRFERLGYKCQVFLLNAATMGVPQKRERVFFIAHKIDETLKLRFTEEPIKFKDIYFPNFTDRKLQPKELALWNNKRPGERNLVNANIRLYNKNGYFKSGILKDNQTPPTVIADDALVLDKEPRHLNKIEIGLIGTFPQDYEYKNIRPEYLIGMSVPPVMMAQVADQVYNQLIAGTNHDGK